MELQRLWHFSSPSGALRGRGSMKGSFQAVGVVTQTFFTPHWVWVEWTQPCYGSGSQTKPWG